MNPLWELFLMRLRALWREPGALFWVFGFPLLTTLALGIAFRESPGRRLAVAVVQGEGAAATRARLERVEGLAVELRSAEGAAEGLTRGQLALAIVPGTPPELRFDPMRAESVTARALALRGLDDRPALEVLERPVRAAGARYVDFLIPGLLGFSIMSSSVWGLGFAVVQMRVGRLLKRFAATPMRRRDFLLAFILGRLVLTLAEVAFFLLFARLLFGVRPAGSVLAFTGVALLGAMSFSALSLLVASRARTTEVANGLMNLVTMPMTVLSGVFFSAANFPSWMQPLLRALPLTALNDALRGILNHGASLAALGLEVAVMTGWGLAAFAVALRLFRWT